MITNRVAIDYEKVIFPRSMMSKQRQRDLHLGDDEEEEGTSPRSTPTPTDVSDDSVDVKVRPVSIPTTIATAQSRRNKRKASEPRRVDKLEAVPPKRDCRWDCDSDDRVSSVQGEAEESEPDHCRLHPAIEGTPTEGTFEDTQELSPRGKQKQRNYKNMTRERRIEANARERTRVHTISAAFESLRRAVPAYSYDQKLSKLAILRIACSYILALASLNDQDYSRERDQPSFAECVDLCTRTIQNEGRARRRKD